jgi:hypothetical protein
LTVKRERGRERGGLKNLGIAREHTVANTGREPKKGKQT